MPGATIRFETSYAEPYPLEVQGESHYRTNLENVSGYTGEDEGVDIDDVLAHLILEDNNPEDINAVRIEIKGRRVGYLTKTAAKKYRKRMKALGLLDIVGECYASIRGGHVLATGGQAHFGVQLDLDIDTFKPYIPRPTNPKPAPQPIQQVEPPPTSSQPVQPAIATPAPAKPTTSQIQKFPLIIPLIPIKSKNFWFLLLIAPIILALDALILTVDITVLFVQWAAAVLAGTVKKPN